MLNLCVSNTLVRVRIRRGHTTIRWAAVNLVAGPCPCSHWGMGRRVLFVRAAEDDLLGILVE